MKKERMTGRKQKSLETKKKLYEIAGELFSQYDFNDVSVDEIMENAGLSKGTFYVHFESKDALIASLLSDYVSQIDMDYQAHLASLPEDMPEADMLLSLIERIADVITNLIGYDRMRTVYKLQLTRVVNMEAVTSYNRMLYQMFSEVLNKGIQRGEFNQKLPVDLLTRHFVMAIRGLCYEWCIRYPDFDLKKQALTHFTILLAGIRSQ